MTLGPTAYLHVERRLDAHHERVMATPIVEQNDGADDDDALDLGVEREAAGNLEPMTIVPNKASLRLNRNAPRETP